MQSSPQGDERVMAIVTEALRRPPGEREEYVRAACLLLGEASEALDWQQRIGGVLREPAASAEPTVGLGAFPATGAVMADVKRLAAAK